MNKFITNGRDYVIAEDVGQAAQFAADFFGVSLADFVRDMPNDNWHILEDDEEFTYYHTEETPVRHEVRKVREWLETESPGYFAYCND